MSRRERVDRTIDSIIGTLENLKTKLPAARTELITQLRLAGELCAADPSRPNIIHTNDTTPTERAVLTRDRVQALLDDLDQTLNAMATIAHNLHRDCDRYIGTRIAVPRCDGGVNYRGYLLTIAQGGWSNPTCTNIPTEGKTCDTCQNRAAMWARRNPKDVRVA